MLSENLGCFCVVFLDVAIFSPYRQECCTDRFVWHMVKDAYLLRKARAIASIRAAWRKERVGCPRQGWIGAWVLMIRSVMIADPRADYR